MLKMISFCGQWDSFRGESYSKEGLQVFYWGVWDSWQ